MPNDRNPDERSLRPEDNKLRAALLLLALLILLPLAKPSFAETLTIAAKTIAEFQPGSEQVTFGKLEFLGGLELTSDHTEFGGISGARFDNQGRLMMVTDKARVIVADLKRNKGAPASLANASISRLKAANGRTITGANDKDSESLEIVGSNYFIGFERNDRLMRFVRQDDTLQADGRYLVNLETEDIPNNRGAEALAYRKETGKLFLVTEMAMDDMGNHKGYVIGDGKIEKQLGIRNRNGFSPTDAAFLDDGSLLLLERYYSPFTGVFMQMRRIAADMLDGDAPLDGDILVEVNRHQNIDNMEALAVSKMPGGGTRLTLLSDDNFSDDQRTLLLEFKLVD